MMYMTATLLKERNMAPPCETMGLMAWGVLQGWAIRSAEQIERSIDKLIIDQMLVVGTDYAHESDNSQITFEDVIDAGRKMAQTEKLLGPVEFNKQYMNVGTDA